MSPLPKLAISIQYVVSSDLAELHVVLKWHKMCTTGFI